MDYRLIVLSEKIGKALKARGLKLATAESCTGGLIASAITEISGSSGWFDRGFVTYSNQAKVEMLNVDPQTLAQFGAVSAETALQMAAGALANSQADWAIAVTGIAGPEGGSTEKPVGTVFISWQDKSGHITVKRLQFSGSRKQIRNQTTEYAMEFILDTLANMK